MEGRKTIKGKKEKKKGRMNGMKDGWIKEGWTEEARKDGRKKNKG